MVKDLLKKFGFSDKEIAVYLALFNLGPSVVSDIAKKADINRSTAYVILDSLIKRGVVSTAERRGVKMYNPIPPHDLIKHFEDMAKEYSELAAQAKKVLPKLKVEEGSGELGPRVRLFEGSEAMKTVYQETLSSLEAIRMRGKKGVSPNITVSDTKIVLMAPGEKFALVIESPELADSLRKAMA